MALISLENVSVSFEGVAAVENASFEIQPGDDLLIVGENGSGKSTLLRTMLGLVHPRTGRIVFGDGLTQNAIGYLPQQTAQQRDFPASAYEVVLSGFAGRLGYRCFYTRTMRMEAEENMRRVDILDLKRKSYKNLSGGQQQRVLLARALCATEKLLLLDEPVSGLDPNAASEMYALLHRLNREKGIAIVMVSHDLDDALRDAKHVAVVNRGIDFFGTKEEYSNRG